MYLQYAFFTELSLSLIIIVQLLGTPNESTWPGVSSYPDYKTRKSMWLVDSTITFREEGGMEFHQKIVFHCCRSLFEVTAKVFRKSLTNVSISHSEEKIMHLFSHMKMELALVSVLGVTIKARTQIIEVLQQWLLEIN